MIEQYDALSEVSQNDTAVWLLAAVPVIILICRASSRLSSVERGDEEVGMSMQ